MKVLTLSNQALVHACADLEQAATAFAPDLIVGIASGGEKVASLMFAGIRHVSIDCHRIGSEKKRSHRHLFSLVRRLPVPMRNALRIIEAKWLSRCASSTSAALSPLAAAAISTATRVLIIDDAVDSGNTLRAVIDKIRSIPGPRAIASAAITVTTPTPLVTPDFTLHNNLTLIRFPWSMDANP